jgi:Na+-driven multidrug efflux pump
MIVLIFRKEIALLYSNDPEVISMVSSVAFYVALFQVCMTLSCLIRSPVKQY